MRLIDADALMEEVKKMKFSQDARRMKVGNEEGLDGFFEGTVQGILAEIPAVEAKPVEWIPCSERLPSTDEYIKNDGRFIVTDGNRVYQSLFDIYDRMFTRYILCNRLAEEDKCAIAWMPLPEPYKEERIEQ